MVLENLPHFALFKELAQQDIALLAPHTELCAFAAGETILNQLDKADKVYLLLSGVAQIWYKPYDGQAILLTEVRENNLVGWSALMGSETYSASVICTEDVTALMISSEGLKSVKAESPSSGQKIFELLSQTVASRRDNALKQVKSMLDAARSFPTDS